MKKFEFLKTYLSPFKPLKPKFYIGKTTIGTPIFYPRIWRKNSSKDACKKALDISPKDYKSNWSFAERYDYFRTCKTDVLKKIGFDFTGLYYKLKWSDVDYRFEYAPVWSFVFFGYQVAIVWSEPCSQYYECWLTYYYATDKKSSVKERIEKAREINPNVWSHYENGKKYQIDYWDKVLKNKHL